MVAKEQGENLFPPRPEKVTVEKHFKNLPDDDSAEWKTNGEETGSAPGNITDDTPLKFDILNDEEQEDLTNILEQPARGVKKGESNDKESKE